MAWRKHSSQHPRLDGRIRIAYTVLGVTSHLSGRSDLILMEIQDLLTFDWLDISLHLRLCQVLCLQPVRNHQLPTSLQQR